MIRLTDAQLNAIYALADAAPAGIAKSSSHSLPTMRILANYGYATITPAVGGAWTAYITPGGQSWVTRHPDSPEKRAATAAAAAMRDEYRARAATYLANAKKALTAMRDRSESNVRVPLGWLNDANPHPGRCPNIVQDAGWWLIDNNYTGSAYSIGQALVHIGESCAYRAYPIIQHHLNQMAEFEADLTEIMNRYDVEQETT